MPKEKPENLKQLARDEFPRYRVSDLKRILKNLNLSCSIFTIRDYETYKCKNYRCGKRYNEELEVCPVCKGDIRKPLIESPRTPGGGSGVGHRRYTAQEIRNIVKVFSKRV